MSCTLFEKEKKSHHTFKFCEIITKRNNFLIVFKVQLFDFEARNLFLLDSISETITCSLVRIAENKLNCFYFFFLLKKVASLILLNKKIAPLF